MSYQEYAHLGRNTWRNRDSDYRDRALRLSRQRDDILGRPFHGPSNSFSIPRQTPPHSSQSSTSSATLSPSNSASQKGNRSPTSDGSKDRPKGSSEKSQGSALLVKKPDLLECELPWRPFYLHRKILFAFMAMFAGLIIAVEVLGNYSNSNGLGNAVVPTKYFWASGPPGILTAAAILWSRVDYQAKFSAPWIRLVGAPSDADKTLLLDYISMAQPMALRAAIRNRDWVVACTTSTSILLSLMIVLSTALITQTLIDAGAQSIPITVQTEFAGNASSLLNASSAAFFSMVGLEQSNLSYPDGVASQYAYQQFSTALPIGTEVNATVDAFSASLDCSVAQLSLSSVQLRRTGQQYNTSISAAGCNITLPIFSKTFANDSDAISGAFFARFRQGGCGGSTKPDDMRIVVVFGQQSIDLNSIPNNPGSSNALINGTILNSTQLICKPTYNISQVYVQQFGLDAVQVTPSQSTQTRQLSAVQPWDIAQALFASFNNTLAASSFSDTTPSFYGTEVVNVDPGMYLALGMQQAAQQGLTDPSSLLEPSALQTVAEEYFQQYTALLAASALTQPANIALTGTAVVSGERLIMDTLVTQLLAGLLVIVMAVTLLAILLVPREGFLPRDPATIIDVAALIAHSRSLLLSLRGVGGGTMAEVGERLRDSYFYTGVEGYENSTSKKLGYFRIFGGQGSAEVQPDYVEPTYTFPFPQMLHPLQRILMIILLTTIVVGLELSLQVSMRNNGLGPVDDDSYVHLLWTCGPALLLSLVWMYFGSVDLTLRTLAPYEALSRETAFEESASLNLVDTSVPSAFIRAIKLRNLAVVGATLAVLLASNFAVLVAPVYSAVLVPDVSNVQLTSTDTFSQPNGGQSQSQNGTIVASLILDDGYPYPPFTFQDMNFPSLSISSRGDSVDLSDDSVVSVTVPAVRPSMACTPYKQSDIHTNMTSGNSSTLRIDLANEPSGSLFISLASNGTGKTRDPNAFFGIAQYKPLASPSQVIPHWVYVWGQLSKADTSQPSVQAISALTCNETVQQLGTMVTLLGASMAIDPSNPPVPNESTATSLALFLDEIDYSGLLNVSSTQRLLDDFFATLVSSQMAVPLSDLGDSNSSTAQSVADAIVMQHKIIRAQVINTENRQPVETISFGRPLADLINAPTTFSGVLTARSIDAGGGTHRVIQDMIPTRILQGILAMTVIASVVTWIGLPKPNILPRSPNSIGSVAAFLADGNLFGLLGRGAEWQDTSDLRAFFMDGIHVTRRFKIGWDRLRRRRREDTLSVWGMNGSYPKDQAFAIGAVRTGGWGGGEGVGLGMQARVGFAHRQHVRDWGWRT